MGRATRIGLAAGAAPNPLSRLSKRQSKQPVSPRFVLIDPSIVGVGGHYLGYAEGVLRAASAAGFEPVLLANAAFSPERKLPFRWRALFEFDIWARADKAVGLDAWRDDPAIRSLLRARYGRVGLLWEASKDLAGLAHHGAAFPLRPALLRRLGGAARLRLLAESLFAQKVIDARALGRDPDQERGLHFTLLRDSISESGRRLKAGLAAPSSQGFEALGALGGEIAAAASFTKRFAAAAKELGLNAADHVFMPTLSFHDLGGLRDALAADEDLRQPIYHLLCRRDIYRGYSDEFDRQEWGAHKYRFALHAFREAAGETRVHFYTDTEELSAQYDRLDAFRFATLPVPVDLGPSSEPSDAPDFPAAARTIGIVSPPGQRAAEVLSIMADQASADLTTLPGVVIAACDDSSPSRTGAASARFRDASIPVVTAGGADWARAFCESVDAVALTDLEVPGGRAAFVMAAIEARRPVILSAGLPETVAVARVGAGLHRRLVERQGEIVSDLGPDPHAFAWRRYYPDGRDIEEEWVCDAAGVEARSEGLTYTRVPLSAGATHLWLNLPEGVAAAGLDGRMPVTELTAAFQSAGQAVDSDRLIYATHAPRDQADAGGVLSIMLGIPDGATEIWLAVRAFAGGRGSFRLDRFRCRCVRLDGVVPIRGAHVEYAPGPVFEATLGRLGDAIAAAAGDLPAYEAMAPFWSEQSSRKPRAIRPLTGAYLGDAREEKGFHLLPHVVGALASDPMRGRRLRYNLQAYPPLTAPDVRMLMAVDALEHFGPSVVRLMRRPLGAGEYNDVLKSCDFMFVAYKRENYTARSSGVFAEAMAAAKPAIVAAGTWMSRIMDQASNFFHDSVIDPAWVLADENLLRSAHWHVMGSQTESPLERDGVRIRRDRTAFVERQPARGATHVRLTFAHDGRLPDQHTLVNLAQLSDPDGAPSPVSVEISMRTLVLGGVGDKRMSLVVPLAPGADRLWIGFYNAFTMSEFDLIEPRLSWIRAPEPIAESAFGVKYPEDASENENRRQITAAVALLADSYESCRSSFAISAPDWPGRSSYAALVAALLNRTGPAETFWSRDRISAQEW